MVQKSSPHPLETYLVDSGILNVNQLDLAKRLQQRQQGPLLMILLELNFITLEQLNGLLDQDYAMGF